jgi:preprotein translocase subunit SecA
MHPSELDEVEAAPRGRGLEDTRERHPPVDDVVSATTWWGRFKYTPETAVGAAPSPYRASPKVGRNEPCPCGSGKKFK